MFWRNPNRHDQANDQFGGKYIYPLIMWFIWKAKNNMMFQGAEHEPHDILKHARSEYLAWKESHVKFLRLTARS